VKPVGAAGRLAGPEPAKGSGRAPSLLPTATIAGVAAVLDYVNEPSWGEEHDDKETILVEAFKTSEEAALAFLPMIAATLRRLAVVS